MSIEPAIKTMLGVIFQSEERSEYSQETKDNKWTGNYWSTIKTTKNQEHKQNQQTNKMAATNTHFKY